MTQRDVLVGAGAASMPGPAPVEDPPARVGADGDRAGRPCRSFAGRVPEDSAAPPAGAGQRRGAVTFDVPPGQLDLKMVVEGAAAR